MAELVIPGIVSMLDDLEKRVDQYTDNAIMIVKSKSATQSFFSSSLSIICYFEVFESSNFSSDLCLLVPTCAASCLLAISTESQLQLVSTCAHWCSPSIQAHLDFIICQLALTSYLNSRYLIVESTHQGWGIPTAIISDPDRRFMSEFWRGIFDELETLILASIAYHP